MNTLTKQKIRNNLQRLLEISRDRNDPPQNCSPDENDLWITYFADIPEMDVEDFYEIEYAAGGGFEYIRRY
jgi:hypothetical protein